MDSGTSGHSFAHATRSMNHAKARGLAVGDGWPVENHLSQISVLTIQVCVSHPIKLLHLDSSKNRIPPKIPLFMNWQRRAHLYHLHSFTVSPPTAASQLVAFRVQFPMFRAHLSHTSHNSQPNKGDSCPNPTPIQPGNLMMLYHPLQLSPWHPNKETEFSHLKTWGLWPWSPYCRHKIHKIHGIHLGKL